jgi:hypothetical protein
MTPPPSKKDAQRASKAKERGKTNEKYEEHKELENEKGHSIRVEYKIHVITKLKRLIIEQLSGLINFI